MQQEISLLCALYSSHNECMCVHVYGLLYFISLTKDRLPPTFGPFSCTWSKFTLVSAHPGARFMWSLRSTASTAMHTWGKKLCVILHRRHLCVDSCVPSRLNFKATGGSVICYCFPCRHSGCFFHMWICSAVSLQIGKLPLWSRCVFLTASVQDSFIANWKASTTYQYCNVHFRDIQSHDMWLK